MDTEIIVQGRSIGPSELALIRRLLAETPCRHRTRLSMDLCEIWNWRNAAGQLKDMACRTLLLKLEKRGLIVLPPRLRSPVNAARNSSLPLIEHNQTPIAGSLRDVTPLSLRTIAENTDELLFFKSLIVQHHYLGLRTCVGENIKYLIKDNTGRPLACALFGSAAWKCAARDTFIGWESACRERNLFLLTNNTRFLVLPWVRVPCLASHILSRITRRIRADWQAKYGHPLSALETFVDRDRFRGTCYQAANWVRVGQTQGRTRNDRYSRIRVSIKDVYVCPLVKNFRGELCHD